MAPPLVLTPEEERILVTLRWLRRTYQNFTLTVYGQGSAKRQVLDLAWSPRIRLTSTEPLPLSVDD